MRVSPCYVSVKRIRYSHIIYLLHKGLRISLNLNENYVFMAHLNKYKKRTERMFVRKGRRKSFRRANVKWCEKMSIKVKLVRWVFYFLYGSYRYTHTPQMMGDTESLAHLRNANGCDICQPFSFIAPSSTTSFTASRGDLNHFWMTLSRNEECVSWLRSICTLRSYHFVINSSYVYEWM